MSAFIGNRNRRVKAAGAAVGAAVAALCLVFGGDREREAAETAPAAPGRPETIVQLTSARDMEFVEAVSSDGTFRAKFSSLVSPRIGGVVDRIFVREGDRVEQGRTKLFQIDDEKLRQAVDKAGQSLVISKSTRDEKRAVLLKANADLRQAEKDFARAKSLYEQKVIPLSEYELAETRVVQLRAEEKVAETNVTLAGQNVALAEISLRMAEKDLRDSTMFSPIDGVVSARYSEPGETGGPDAPILRIDDVKSLKALAYLPGQYYPRISIGSTAAVVSVHGKHIGGFPVAYKAPVIDSALRTFEIWADVSGDGAYSVPGAQCVIKVILRRTRGVGVPRDAVQRRDGKDWIFVPDGGVAKMVEVKKGLDTDGWTELLDAPIKGGDPVITQGQFLLEDGYPVRERGESGPIKEIFSLPPPNLEIPGAPATP
ncbi:MAG: efflux RND transporter periplasmic adaptor subunit [Planctomycetota bacterium]|jgi:HlyD family secretion protein|nr:efflux RND transporter periplasmic adaptor subunit [Planctomycetota bacterium]